MVSYLKLVPTYTYYWSFIDWDGEEYDADFDTQQEAQEAADEAYEAYCEEESESRFDYIDIIRYYIDDESGERVEVQRVFSSVEYEYYHGDYEEHRIY